jgi:hypothetical protein
MCSATASLRTLAETLYLKDVDDLEREIAWLYRAGLPVNELGRRLRSPVYHYSAQLG